MSSLALIATDPARDALLGRRRTSEPFRHDTRQAAAEFLTELGRIHAAFASLRQDGIDAQVLASKGDHDQARQDHQWAHAYVIPGANVDAQGRIADKLWLACGDTLTGQHETLAHRIAQRLRELNLPNVTVRNADPSGVTIHVGSP